MGVRRNFSRWAATSTLRLSFLGCWRRNANGPSQNAIPFLRCNANSPRKHAFAFFWNRILVEFYSSLRKGCRLLSVILYSFCWIGVSSNIIIIVNCRQRSLNWTWTILNYVCGAFISLGRLNLTSQSLFWNIFYTSAIRNTFSFHKLI